MSNMFARDIDRAELVRAIATLGSDITFVVEGHIGSSKSAMLADLALMKKDTHRPVYIDMTQIADSGDFQIPAVDHKTKTSSFYPNESLGLHLDQPMIIMLDEFGKANQQIRNAVLPVLNERRWGNRYFHKDTIVFATTNIGAEAVGDLLKPHERNRVTFVRMKKPDAEEFLRYGAEHNLHPLVATWVYENPHCFASFEDVEPAANKYIYHPKEFRPAFVTHRSLMRASVILHKAEGFSDDALFHMLAGTVGAPAASDILALKRLQGELPSRDDIVKNPKKATVPDSPAALILLVCNASQWVEEDTIDSWLTYMERIDKPEAKAMFLMQVVARPGAINWLSKNRKFTKLATEKFYLFGGRI